MSKIAILGDIHGCLQEFKLLLNELKSVERIVLAGDLIDRGDDSTGVVRLARERNLELVKGNHEEKMLRWLDWESKRGDKKNPVQVWPDREQEWRSLSDDDVAYLRQGSPFLRLNERWVVVHAGFACDSTPIEEQEFGKICRILYVSDDTGRYIKPDRNHKKPAGASVWMTRWNQKFNVVYGHAVHSYDVPRVIPADNGYYTYGIDTGCVFGGKLTALVFDDQKSGVDLIQIPAAKEYYKARELTGED